LGAASLSIGITHHSSCNTANMQEYSGAKEKDVPHHNKHKPNHTIENLVFIYLAQSWNDYTQKGRYAGIPLWLYIRNAFPRNGPAAFGTRFSERRNHIPASRTAYKARFGQLFLWRWYILY